MKTRNKTKDLVMLSLFSALIIVLATVPGIGYIPLGVINATTMHIPVIIGSILLGPKKGAFLGGIFGLTSFLKATFTPNLTSFVFTPFYSLSPEYHGNMWSILICFLPRILVGIVPYYINYIITKKNTKKENILSLSIASFLGSMTNTLLVMNMIYIFFGKSYGAASGVSGGIYAAISAVIITCGIPEAIVASIISTVLCKALIPLTRKFHS